MSVNVAELAARCVQFHVIPDTVSSERSAHALLRKLDAEPGTVLQWIVDDWWQLEQGGRVLCSSSFENCVCELARRCAAAQGGRVSHG